MWKDTYRIGVPLIDEQHKQLFNMVDNLLETVQNGSGDVKQECISAIAYLKNYTLQHFRDEEHYQKSINYSGYDEHVHVHKRLVRDVLKHERKMVLSDFNMNSIKDFLGMLMAWLVCHVAGDDQLIVAENRQSRPVRSSSAVDSFFYMSICDILSRVSGLSMKNMKVIKSHSGDFESTISVQVNFNGDVSGSVTYNYAKQLAFNLIESMASFTPDKIDEIVLSAMLEISSITSIKSSGMMSVHGYSCEPENSNIRTLPAFMPATDSIILDTGIGMLEMDVSLV